MDFDEYKNSLENNLAEWLEQITEIQNKEFNTEEVLFDLNENTLDAFSAMVDSYSSGTKIEDWLENEKIRQKQKSLQTKMGDLHEIMIRSLKPSIKKKEAENVDGSTKKLRIFDLYDDSHKWIAEVKNKHNTTKGDDRKASFEKLEKGLKIKGEGYTAYYVTILRDSHSKVKKPFTPSDNTSDNSKNNPNIIHIDGESFYELITGDIDALSKSFDVLREIIAKHYQQPHDISDLLDNVKNLSFFKTQININKSGISALCYLPGIGVDTAQKIIAYRASRGPFENIDELIKVNGIGKTTLDKIKDYQHIVA